MKIEEANKILEEMNVYPEELKGESKRLFEAIMKIADRKDEAEADLYEANNCISDLLDVAKEREKMIDEMAKYIDDFQMKCNKYYKDKEDVIKTFEKRCKNGN